MASKICNIVNINLASIVIEIMMWITYAAFFGYLACAEMIYIFVPKLLTFSLVILMIMVMLLLELYGTAKKHQETMNAAIVIRFIKLVSSRTIIELITSGLLYLWTFGLMLVFWDIYKIILEKIIIESMKKEDDDTDITSSV